MNSIARVWWVQSQVRFINLWNSFETAQHLIWSRISRNVNMWDTQSSGRTSNGLTLITKKTSSGLWKFEFSFSWNLFSLPRSFFWSWIWLEITWSGLLCGVLLSLVFVLFASFELWHPIRLFLSGADLFRSTAKKFETHALEGSVATMSEEQKYDSQECWEALDLEWIQKMARKLSPNDSTITKSDCVTTVTSDGTSVLTKVQNTLCLINVRHIFVEDTISQQKYLQYWEPASHLKQKKFWIGH